MAQLFHDRKQKEARRQMTPEQRADAVPVDYLRPIIGTFCIQIQVECC